MDGEMEPSAVQKPTPQLRPLVCDAFQRHFRGFRQTVDGLAAKKNPFGLIVLNRKFLHSFRRLIHYSRVYLCLTWYFHGREDDSQPIQVAEFHTTVAHVRAAFRLIRAVANGQQPFRKFDVHSEDGDFGCRDSLIEMFVGVPELAFFQGHIRGSANFDPLFLRLGPQLRKLTCQWTFLRTFGTPITFNLDEFSHFQPDHGPLESKLDMAVLLVHRIRRLRLTFDYCGTYRRSGNWSELHFRPECPVQPAVEELILEVNRELDGLAVTPTFFTHMPNLKKVSFFVITNYNNQSDKNPASTLTAYLNRLHAFGEETAAAFPQLQQVVVGVQLQRTPPFDVITKNAYFQRREWKLIVGRPADRDLRIVPNNQQRNPGRFLSWTISNRVTPFMYIEKDPAEWDAPVRPNPQAGDAGPVDEEPMEVDDSDNEEDLEEDERELEEEE
ncbi:hypothetical protein M3Y99_00115000 [Aphelenchoides fujianensis]|nr:hypothetical protein M3Y99_00115000 [Aphelenchoides fujianensis]